MAELTAQETKSAIDYYNGVADKLTAKGKLLEARIEVGRSRGAENPADKNHEFFKKLVDEWLTINEQAEEFRISASKLIFKE